VSEKMTRTYQARAYYSTPEPPPIANNNPSIHDLVIQDMQDRKQFGLDKYGTILQACNGRKTVVDLHQELLDAVVYSRSLIEEQNAIIKALLLMCQQYLSISKDNDLSHWHMTAGEFTLDLLESLGYVQPNKALPEAWQFTEKAIAMLDDKPLSTGTIRPAPPPSPKPKTTQLIH
jgi:hypothetical protein